ncbi:hypothetical protein K491DRAFT_692862 [Lophiostoma macrostomum CBS 122681]|uniref:Uncharacterized protein n=1 Tax=Lophiostoma macrostomum CBS 122681 TaxID=1314788 RepID=A0A6A6T9I4_9PLEO|nr:hypothetical protein K491DRAFT_692862 [Lophiostoma macrostomum CBS 122681]
MEHKSSLSTISTSKSSHTNPDLPVVDINDQETTTLKQFLNESLNGPPTKRIRVAVYPIYTYQTRTLTPDQRQELRIARVNISHYFSAIDVEIDTLETSLKTATQEVRAMTKAHEILSAKFTAQLDAITTLEAGKQALGKENAVLEKEVARLERELAGERAKSVQADEAIGKLAQVKRKWSDFSELMA